ncbi:MAG: hypothetical protein ACRBCJ_14295 [Hyphomicrobiaceae bacterium]
MMQRAKAQSSLFLLGAIAIPIAFGTLLGSWPYSANSLQKGFEAALAERDGAAVTQAARRTGFKDVAISKTANSSTVAKFDGQIINGQISGSEEFWLSQTHSTGATPKPVALAGPFKLGDQLTIGHAESKRIWTVVNISEIEQLVTATSIDQNPSSLLVTLQDQTSNPVAGPIIRIIVDSNELLS